MFHISLLGGFVLLITFSWLWIHYNAHQGFQNCWEWQWSSAYEAIIGGTVLFAIDGLSLWFIGLSILLLPICVLISKPVITFLHKEFYLFLYGIVACLILVFSVLDLLGFYILFESILIPMFFMIGIWGSREAKIKAAFYFFFYTLIGSLLMLIAILKVYSLTGSTNIFYLQTLELPLSLQKVLFLGFFIGFAVKVPMIPFHLWLPQAHVEAPVAGSVLLAGILLKLGGYGCIRILWTITPNAMLYYSPLVITMSVLAVVWGSWTTLRQNDMKRLIAYSSVAHMGIVTLSIFTCSLEGYIAAMLMMIAHGFVSAALFMCISILYVRHHSRILKYYRGLVTSMPLFSTLFFILILGNLGFPWTLNFIAEWLSLLAAAKYSPIILISLFLGLLLTTAYNLYMYNRITFGTLSPHLSYSRDLYREEAYALLPLLGLTLYTGIFPNIIIQSIIWSGYIHISL